MAMDGLIAADFGLGLGSMGPSADSTEVLGADSMAAVEVDFMAEAVGATAAAAGIDNLCLSGGASSASPKLALIETVWHSHPRATNLSATDRSPYPVRRPRR